MLPHTLTHTDRQTQTHALYTHLYQVLSNMTQLLCLNTESHERTESHPILPIDDNDKYIYLADNSSLVTMNVLPTSLT